MQRIYVYALINHCKDILETLQRRGVIDIENIDSDDGVFIKQDTSSLRSSYERSAKTARSAAEILDEYVQPKKGLLSSFEGRRQISVGEYESFVKNEQEILKAAYETIAYKKNISQYESEIAGYRSQLETISPWLSLDVPMSFSGTKTTSAFIGELPGVWDETKILTSLAQVDPDVDGVDVEIIHTDENHTCIFAVSHINDRDAVHTALRKIGFSYPSYISKEIPKDRQKSINKHISNRNGRILECTKNIEQNAKYRDAILLLEDYYSMKAERYEVVDNLISTEHTFILTGYIAKSDVKKLADDLQKDYDAYVEVEDSDTDDTPVKLKNNKFAEPVEGVLTTFSTPNRHEADPTSIMAVFYYIFFGMMFSDAGYGLVMSIACFIALVKFKGMEDSLRRSVKMFFWCGVSTLFWGLMFGSFFGDAVSVISQTFFNSPPPQIPGIVIPIWFDPVNNSMRLLMFAFLLGIIHLFAGLAIQAYNHIRNKRYLDVLYDVVSWYLLVGGGILALLSLDMMQNIAGFTLPPIWLTVGGVMALLGAAIILFFAGRESKNPIKRLLKGAYGLYGATGYLSDILSYSRLLALGLATGVIAQVFNQIGSMMGSGFFGTLLFIIVFVIGHSLNIGINALGAYVHTNRLQFVEFFGKFYTGGGREFMPFKINTKHFIVKEEK